MSRTKAEPDPFDVVETCPVCGHDEDTCVGHGGAGDPVGRMILARHALGDHADCHPDAECE